MIRRAVIADVPALGRIINTCAEYGLMLHRSHEHLYEHLRDFHVAIEDDAVAGVCGLRVVWSDLAEIYALAVDPARRRRRWGRRLVEAGIDDARTLGIRRLMALTYEQAFFAKLGFEPCDRQQLPLKVWSECVRCLKHHSCDEVAMVRTLTDVPDQHAPDASSVTGHAYVVPVTLKIARTEPRPKMDEAP